MAPRTGSTPTRSGRADGDRDPDDVGDIISRFVFPSAAPSSAAEHVAVREIRYYLKAQGRATRRDIVDAVYQNSKVANIYDRPSRWFRHAVLPYLPELPHVTSADGGSTWVFDPNCDPDDRPDVPVDPSHPSDSAVDAAIDRALDDVGLEPGNSEVHLRNRNRQAVREAYDLLRDEGSAGRDRLRETYTPTTAPVENLFEDPARGFRVAVSPVLRRCPGVVGPSVVGQPYLYVGVGTNPE